MVPPDYRVTPHIPSSTDLCKICGEASKLLSSGYVISVDYHSGYLIHLSYGNKTELIPIEYDDSYDTENHQSHAHATYGDDAISITIYYDGDDYVIKVGVKVNDGVEEYLNNPLI